MLTMNKGDSLGGIALPLPHSGKIFGLLLLRGHYGFVFRDHWRRDSKREHRGYSYEGITHLHVLFPLMIKVRGRLQFGVKGATLQKLQYLTGGTLAVFHAA